MNNQFIQGVLFDWNKINNDSYLKQIEALKGIERLDFNNSITFFVGENGSGKSTLLEAIAVAHGFNPEGGTKNYAFSTHDTHSELCDAIKITKGYRKEKWGYFLRAESFYNVATQEEKYADIQIDFAKDEEIKILEYTDSNRVKTVQFGNHQLSGVETRTLLGLKSTNFEISKEAEIIKFEVKGYGHGVGMSQTGADTLAKQGENYEEIIHHFYANVEIQEINS